MEIAILSTVLHAVLGKFLIASAYGHKHGNNVVFNYHFSSYEDEMCMRTRPDPFSATTIKMEENGLAT